MRTRHILYYSGIADLEGSGKGLLRCSWRTFTGRSLTLMELHPSRQILFYFLNCYLLFTSSFLCVWECLFKWLGVHVIVGVCAKCFCCAQRSALDSCLQALSALFLWECLSLAQNSVLSLAQNSVIWLDCLVSKLRRSTCFLPSCGITSMCHTWLITCGYWGLNSGPRSCTENSLLIERPLQLQIEDIYQGASIGYPLHKGLNCVV